MFNKTAVVDLDSIVYTAGHPSKKLDEFGEPIRENNKFVYIEKDAKELIDSARNIMEQILLSCKADSYIAFVKGKNTIKSRLEVNSGYKQNRKGEYPVWINFLADYYITQWNAVVVDNMEVDDAVNIVRLQIPNSFIVAKDKDLLSLEGTHFNWNIHKWVTVSESEAEYNFWSDMIIGQPGDNIKGIPKKGKKFAEQLYEECSFDLKGVQTQIQVFRDEVFDYYIKYFGESIGIQEFYKNYMCLKILEKSDGFVTPNPIEFKLDVKERNNR